MTEQVRNNLSIKIGELELAVNGCRYIKIKPDLSNIKYGVMHDSIEGIENMFSDLNSVLRAEYEQLEDKKAKEIKELDDALENESQAVIDDKLQGRTYEQAKADIVASYDKRAVDIKPIILKLDEIKELIEDIKNPNRVKASKIRKFI